MFGTGQKFKLFLKVETGANAKAKTELLLLGFVPYRCLHCGIFSLLASLSFEFVFPLKFYLSNNALVLLSLEFSFSSKFIILCAMAGKLSP